MDYKYHIFSPYRVCPLGAHVDHQHGLVTGFAIDKGVDLWFNVRADSRVVLESQTFTGHVEFDIATPTLVKQGNWGIMRAVPSLRCRSGSSSRRLLPADYDFEVHKELVPMQPGDVPPPMRTPRPWSATLASRRA